MEAKCKCFETDEQIYEAAILLAQDIFSHLLGAHVCPKLALRITSLASTIATSMVAEIGKRTGKFTTQDAADLVNFNMDEHGDGLRLAASHLLTMNGFPVAPQKMES